jgi:hypothetical protein
VWKRWKKHSVNELQEHIERQELKGTSTAPKVRMQGTKRFPKDVLEKSSNRLFGLEAQICYPAWIGGCRDKGVTTVATRRFRMQIPIQSTRTTE